MFMTSIFKISFATLLALSACSAPQYSDLKIQSEVTALSKAAPNAPRQRTTDEKMSGDFKGDLSRAILISPEYLEALSSATEARFNVLVSSADQKVQVSASGNAGRSEKSGAGSANTAINGASANLSVSQLIYDGGAAASMINSAQAKSFIANTEVEIVANKTAHKAAVAWVDLHILNERKKALQALTTKAEEMLGQMETLVSSGMIDKSAGISAEIAVRSLLLEKSNLEAQTSASTARFVKNFGGAPKNLLAPPSLFAATDLNRIQKEWNSSPIILQSAANVLAAKQNLLAAKGSEEPTVNLKAGIASPMDRGEQRQFALGFEVRWILGDGGRREAKTAAQTARLEAAQQALEGIKLIARTELDIAVSQRATLVESIETLSVQEVSSKKEIQILWSQLATGQTTVRQLIQAEINGYRNSNLKIDAQAELTRLEFKMLANSGLLVKKLGLHKNKTQVKAT